jgi:hypothetical protein
MYSYTIFDPIPPSILYVNPAMSELTGYTWVHTRSVWSSAGIIV